MPLTLTILTLTLLQPGECALDADAGAIVRLTSPTSARVLITGEGEASGAALIRGHGAAAAEVRRDLILDENDWRVGGAVTGPDGGVMGLSLALRGIPDELDVILPASSGLCFTAASPVSEYRAEWPLTWEAGFAILQGESEGLLVYSEDPKLSFKAITLRHRAGFWDIILETHNQAPFDDLTAHAAPPWVLVPYEGDWRVGARRYRAFLESRHDLAAASASQPDWVRDIRCCVLLPAEESLLEPLSKRVDARQTLLYIPSWREDGYDRNYPDYTPLEGFKAFIDHAHALGFRVMPHANYFGVDPLNPLYARFAPHQMQDRDSGELLWWDWARAEPPIKFAYIHPGLEAWQEELVARLRAAHEELGFDAIHIDQTLCIFNSRGGLVDGRNCAEGNLELHRALREAIPDLALSGEGLDEVTFVHEAFAQRHVWGLNHVDRTWDRAWLERAHPISSYLFTPHTTIYGYLGMSSPGDGQYYAAWRHAYRRWNVIPTVAWPSAGALGDPTGFWAQAFTEARAWQKTGLVPAPDGDWPADASYPYTTANGEAAAYREDSGTVFEVAGREVTRTLTGVSEAALPGSIAGWSYYDADSLKGLDPSMWYAYDAAPRRMDVLHVERAPEGMAVTVNAPPEGLTRIHLRDTRAAVDLAARLSEATCGVRVGEEIVAESRGELLASAAYGAMVSAQGETLHFHPAWQPDADGRAVRGAPFARWELDLPADGPTVFTAEARIDAAAGDRTDGVDFLVSANAGDDATGITVHASSDGVAWVFLDLSGLRGRRVVLEVSCDDGPADNPSFDWARMDAPRLVTVRGGSADLVVAGVETAPHPDAVEVPRQANEPARFTLPCPVNGAVYLDAPEPTAVIAGADLAALPWLVSFREPDGSDRSEPGLYAGLSKGVATCGGVTHAALHTHPPDRGQTVVQAPVALPAGVERFRCLVGLRDGSKSTGVRFSVWLGGREIASRVAMPDDGWQPLEAEIAEFAGAGTVLELVADSAGDYTFDWACWAELAVE